MHTIKIQRVWLLPEGEHSIDDADVESIWMEKSSDGVNEIHVTRTNGWELIYPARHCRAWERSPEKVITEDGKLTIDYVIERLADATQGSRSLDQLIFNFLAPYKKTNPVLPPLYTLSLDAGVPHETILKIEKRDDGFFAEALGFDSESWTQRGLGVTCKTEPLARRAAGLLALKDSIAAGMLIDP